MGDLIERLRGPCPSIPAMRDAADEIERLQRQLDAGIEAGWHALRNERDALRARIEGAMVVKATRNGIVRSEARMNLIGKRVALVVIE